MLSKIKKIYDILPKEYLKFLRYIPDRVLFGKSYGIWKDKVSFDKSLIDQNLFDTLNYARVHTQFGRDHIPENFAIHEARSILESLPLVTSADLSTNLDYYTSDEFNRFNSYKTTTGGSGRNPTTILLANEAYGIEWAHGLHFWQYSDYKKSRDLKLTLRGKSLKGSKLVEYSPIYNELIVDTFKVKDANFLQFISEIKKYNIKYIFGYPSLVKEFMGYFQKYDYVPELKGILLSSEEINTEEKHLFTEFFKTSVLSFYGQTEKVTFAVDLEANGMHRVYTSYGYPRIIDGEIVATSFVNRALPLINYRTGDGAEIIEDDKYLYLKHIKGRWGKDFVYLDQNKKIPTSSINLHSSIQNEILFYQIHQKEFAKIEIKLLPKLTSKISTDKLISIFGKEMRNNLKDFNIDIVIVTEEKIEKSLRGKMILLVQKLPQQGKAHE